MKAFRLFLLLCCLLLTTTACSSGIPKHDPEQELLVSALYLDNNRILCLYSSMEEQKSFLELYDTQSRKTKTIALSESLGGVLPAGIVKGREKVYVFEGHKAAVLDPETLQAEELVSIGDLSTSDEPLSVDGQILFRTDRGLSAAPLQHPQAARSIRENQEDAFFHWGKWSPDGKKAAYYLGTNLDPASSLCIQTIETGEEIVIPFGIACNNYQWSNQSNEIAAAGQRPEGPPSLFLFDGDTGELTKEIDLTEFGPDLENGCEILDFQQGILLLQIFPGDPDGQKAPVLVYDLKDDTLEYLTPKDYFVTSASLSPDGTEAAVCHQNGPVQLEIFPLP